MEEENQSGKKKPQLKVVDDVEDVHRLDANPEETSPARKKTTLRRSNEDVAMKRDLIDREIPPPTQAISREPEVATSVPAAPLRLPPALFILAAAAFLLLLGLGIFMALGGRDREARFAMQERSREKLAEGRQEKESAREIVKELTTTLEAYSSARTLEEKLAHVRQPERVGPLMKEYYANNDLDPRIGAELVSQYALPIESRSFVVLAASFPDGESKVYLAEVEDDFKITIDWESDVCYQTVDVAEYIREKPTEATTLRVFAIPDNFYVYEFSDSKKYQCLKLTFRDSDDLLFGYVEHDSLTSRKLARQFSFAKRRGQWKPEPLLIKVRFLENSKSERGVLIEELIAPRWANIDEFEDEE